MPTAPPGRSTCSQRGQRLGQQVERSPLEPLARPAAVLDAVRRVGDDRVEAAGPEDLGGLAGVGEGVGQGEGVARGPGLLVGRELDVETTSQRATVAAQPGGGRGVLEPLVLQPAGQERGVRVEVAAVDLEARRMPAVHEHLVERRAPATEGIEDPQPVGQHAGCGTRGEDGHVEQQLGEQLVGLALVLQDRQQVVVEAVEAVQLHRTERHPVSLTVTLTARSDRSNSANAVETLATWARPSASRSPSKVTYSTPAIRSMPASPSRVGEHGLGEGAQLGDGQRARPRGRRPGWRTATRATHTSSWWSRVGVHL